MRHGLKACLGFLMALLGIPGPSRGETIYAVDASQVLSVNTVTRVTTQLFDLSSWSPGGTAWQNGGNALAFDAFANNLIFAERGGNRVATYNLGTGTASVLANLDSFSSVTSQITAGTVVGRMQSGAFFYNDSYYFTVENMNNGGGEFSRLFRAYMNPGHTAFTSIGIVTFGGGNPWLGDFGDMAVKTDGTVYGSSTDGGSSGPLDGFWTFNINSPGAGITTISTSTPLAQLAFSADESTLFASRSTVGDLGTINTATGSYTNLGSLSGASTSLTDMTQATSPVPEPSSAVLLIVGILLLCRRRHSRDPLARIRTGRAADPVPGTPRPLCLENLEFR